MPRNPSAVEWNPAPGGVVYLWATPSVGPATPAAAADTGARTVYRIGTPGVLVFPTGFRLAAAAGSRHTVTAEFRHK